MRNLLRISMCILLVTFSQGNDTVGGQYDINTTMENPVMVTSLDKEYVSIISLLTLYISHNNIIYVYIYIQIIYLYIKIYEITAAVFI